LRWLRKQRREERAWICTASTSAWRTDTWRTLGVSCVRADERLKSLGRDDEVKHVETALADIDDAQRLAGKLDQNANSRAGEAATIVSNVLDARGEAVIDSSRSRVGRRPRVRCGACARLALPSVASPVRPTPPPGQSIG
jgi:hypothetical protein